MSLDLTQLDTHTHTHTAGRTPLDQWSVRRTGRYLHNTQQTKQSNIQALRGIWTLDPAQSSGRRRTSQTSRPYVYILANTVFLCIYIYIYIYIHIHTVYTCTNIPSLEAERLLCAVRQLGASGSSTLRDVMWMIVSLCVRAVSYCLLYPVPGFRYVPAVRDEDHVLGYAVKGTMSTKWTHTWVIFYFLSTRNLIRGFQRLGLRLNWRVWCCVVG
jgi:hypothetical protein